MNLFEDMTTAQIAEVIGLALEDWHGHCDLVVRRMIDHGLCAFGTLIERASPGPFPDPAEPEQPLIYHYWLRLQDGRVADPTRWCYEGTECPPHRIYVGAGDDPIYAPRWPEPQPRPLDRILQRR